jgi:oxygen-independent coproporphyrinogen-3 oxidase
MVGTGVSAFSHIGGVHFQNADRWDDYLARATSPELPISRAFVTTPDERLTRELVLQMKTGRIERAYFQGKFGVDVVERFAEPLRKLESQELLEIGEGEIRLTRGGLLRVDQLLPEFYAPDYRDSRYT